MPLSAELPCRAEALVLRAPRFALFNFLKVLLESKPHRNLRAMRQVALTSGRVFHYHHDGCTLFKKKNKQKKRSRGQAPKPKIHRSIFLSIHHSSRRNADISGVWNEHFLWQPAHLIHLTLRKTEHLWQTGQRKIEPWILIVEVNEQIGLEVCHLSASGDALAWIHPSTFCVLCNLAEKTAAEHVCVYWTILSTFLL